MDACKDTGEALNVDGVPEFEVVEEVVLEMVVCFTWAKIVLGVYHGAIVLGQSLEREEVGGIIRRLCG
jgi:hypothetical protein